MEIRDQFMGKVRFFFLSKPVSFRWRMAREIRDINLKLKMINEEAISFGLVSQMGNGATASEISAISGGLITREKDSIVGQNIVGRANDASNIVEILLGSSEKVVSVIPITGMGGLGKTTLAQLVFNDQQVDKHFDKKIWICVSENFEVTRLFKLILESLTSRKVEVANRDVFVQEIRKEFLIVLDDVWNEVSTLWDEFFQSFVGISTTNGNWCIVTTRQFQVASNVATHPPYSLDKLSDEDCWSILQKTAVPSGEKPEELRVIRKKLTNKCGGLPLAASVIGGLLRIKRKEEWLSAVEKGIMSLTGDENSVLQILKLSFDNLPSLAIKKCFVYCSIFGKDCDIEREQIIQLWMAEGFLESNLNNQTVMEEIGHKYFSILLQSSLIQEVRKEEIICGRMHDLVHDLAESFWRSKCIDLENGIADNSSEVSHLVLDSIEGKTSKISKDMSRSLRTLFLGSSISSDMLSKFKYLHVLNLSRAKIEVVPTSTGKLIHLRYLDLSDSRIKTLLECLLRLYNLQTLRMYSCPALKDLPEGMSSLINLRHLCYYNDAKFLMPKHMGLLTCLQTLKFFNVGEEKGRHIEELGCLENLRGGLEIRNLELVNGTEGAQQANLFGKLNLHELHFKWGRTRDSDSDDENVLEGLQPHPNLQVLVIENYIGDHIPSWVMNLSASFRLTRLCLTDCRRCTEIPALGQLPLLQDLKLLGLQTVRSIGLSFYGISDHSTLGSYSTASQGPRNLFAALKNLYLGNMRNLIEWMEPTAKPVGFEQVEVFPILETLTISNCTQLTTAPSHFPSLKKLTVKNSYQFLPVQNILSKVTSLLTLSITGMDDLTCVSNLLVHNNKNLQSLRLQTCPNLKCVRGCGTSLRELDIKDCENLRELPEDLYEFRSLQTLSIDGCPSLEAFPFPSALAQLTSFQSLMMFPNVQQRVTSLQNVRICHCDRLIDLPGEMLESCKSLRVLTVYDCPRLSSFPVYLERMPSLSVLLLHKCPNLLTMPRGFGFLTSLRELSIGPLSDTVEFDWLELASSSLRELALFGGPHLDYLPEQLQDLTGLTELSLHDFGIEALPDWFGNLESLEQLIVSGCEKLRYIPSMAVTRRLTKLRSLSINGWPLLEEGCSAQSVFNFQWSGISHIPDLSNNFC
ncbi:putative disease resistance protein RGA3 [Coffea arabica]|uniref:Disease resistance protein RGA3 n=1 Tax=Coffea arabica TaxID=13443 RepID=A0ABM4U897_COFAR